MAEDTKTPIRMRLARWLDVSQYRSAWAGIAFGCAMAWVCSHNELAACFYFGGAVATVPLVFAFHRVDRQNPEWQADDTLRGSLIAAVSWPIFCAFIVWEASYPTTRRGRIEAAKRDVDWWLAQDLAVTPVAKHHESYNEMAAYMKLHVDTFHRPDPAMVESSMRDFHAGRYLTTQELLDTLKVTREKAVDGE